MATSNAIERNIVRIVRKASPSEEIIADPFEMKMSHLCNFLLQSCQTRVAGHDIYS